MNTPVWTYIGQITVLRRCLAPIMVGMAAASCFMVLPATTGVAYAATVTWDGSGDMTWSQPDSTSWSGGTYNSGDTATFAGSGTGTVTIAAGGVDPGSIAINESGYTFAVGENNALGTCAITFSYQKHLTLTNALGGALAIATGVTIWPHPTYGDGLYQWQSGSAIGGSGTYQRTNSWSLPAGFTVRPGVGATPGTLTIDITNGDDLTFDDGRTLEIDFSGSSADSLALTGGGTLTISGTTDKLVLRGAAKSGTHAIASATNASGVFDEEDMSGLVNTRGRVIYQADRILFVVPARGTVFMAH